jgi:hypothetical protein
MVMLERTNIGNCTVTILFLVNSIDYFKFCEGSTSHSFPAGEGGKAETAAAWVRQN